MTLSGRRLISFKLYRNKYIVYVCTSPTKSLRASPTFCASSTDADLSHCGELVPIAGLLWRLPFRILHIHILTISTYIPLSSNMVAATPSSSMLSLCRQCSHQSRPWMGPFPRYWWPPSHPESKGWAAVAHAQVGILPRPPGGAGGGGGADWDSLR